MIKNAEIAVWFSCGACSAAAAKLTVEQYGRDNRVRVLNTPIAEEDEDNQRFRADVQDWIGVKIETVINPKYPSSSAVDVFERRKAMVFPRGAPCTTLLKKEARQKWERENRVDWHVLGFAYDERARHERFVMTERDNLLPVLIDAKLSRAQCAEMVVAAGVSLPRIYREGYPNANCVGCVKATSPTYWNLVRRTRPQVFEARAKQSRRFGVRLVRHKGERIFLDELPADAEGGPLKSLEFECGLFCEETPNDREYEQEIDTERFAR